MYVSSCLVPWLMSDIPMKHIIAEFLTSIQTKLGKRVIFQAKYDAEGQKKREYHDKTRKKVLDKIATWTFQESETARCMWITGKAGVGKSTIGMEVAKRLEDENRLYAQFFITRDIAHTTDPDNIFPTMAWQLAERSPLAAVVIHDKLEHVRASHIKEFSFHQVHAIFVEPLRAIPQYEDKVVIIVDGIDELDNTDPSTLSKVTSVLCRVMHDLPSKVRILVLSRPEQPILEEIIPDIDRLDLALEESKFDVEQMLHSKLHELAEKYKWDDWPSPGQEKKVCELAGGHLGWASFAVAWMVQELRQSYRRGYRRDQVFADLMALPSADLEHLYGLIFTRITPPEFSYSTQNHREFLMGFQIVIGSLAIVQEPLTISAVADLVLFDLKSCGLDPFDTVGFLNNMSSIFMNGTDLMSNETVPRAHKSVFDYLMSDRPDRSLQLSPPEHHTRMTKTCFHIFREELCFNIGRIKTSHKRNEELSGSEMQHISPHIAYVCKSLGLHLEKAKEPYAFLSDVDDFMKNNFLQWLEVLSLTGEVDSAKSTLHVMEMHVGVSTTSSQSNCFSLRFPRTRTLASHFSFKTASNLSQNFESLSLLAPLTSISPLSH